MLPEEKLEQTVIDRQMVVISGQRKQRGCVAHSPTELLFKLAEVVLRTKFVSFHKEQHGLEEVLHVIVETNIGQFVVNKIGFGHVDLIEIVDGVWIPM